ncbi:uncharacterized protein LODBEIA_P44460 [Lodderomyces beijingensis]|uniref:chitinase n=1 Tax=Lodderomyces beijingensis TaxID=1775926 RepID=A0ABP0ZS92_9ASCO
MDKFRARLSSHEPGKPIIPDSERFKTCVYFTNWAVYGKKHFPSDIPYEYYTHIFYAFLAIDTETGELKFTDEWCDLQLEQKSLVPGKEKIVGNLESLRQLKRISGRLKVVMSIGGWGTSHQFEAITSSDCKLQRFVDSVVAFVGKHGFDGVDIDWEYPKNPQESNAFARMIKGIRQALPLHYSLSIAAPAGKEHMQYIPFKDVDQYISFYNLMAYDFAGQGWSAKTGYHSNLFGNNGDNDLCAHDVVQTYLQKGISAKKLILGMPMYGRIFSGVDACGVGQSFQKSGSEDTVNYNKIEENMDCHFDSRKVAAFAYNAATKELTTFDNAQSAKIKGSYVRSNGLGGGMWWDSSGDKPITSEKGDSSSLVYNFVEQLGGTSALE